LNVAAAVSGVLFQGRTTGKTSSRMGRAKEPGGNPLEFADARPSLGNPPPAAKDSAFLSPSRRLQFGLRVGIDFAVQADFFKLRSCPFHNLLLKSISALTAALIGIVFAG
jgi:hypothetical protein